MQKLLKSFDIIFGKDANLSKEPHFSYNYLLGVAMLYVSLMHLSGLLVYKTVTIFHHIFPAGLFIPPITYCIANITSEVYGFKTARNMMWWFIFSSAIYTILASLSTQFSPDPKFEYHEAYNFILETSLRVFFAGILGTIVGQYFNMMIVSKLKVWMTGRNYPLRSLISTIGGECIYNAIAYPIMFCLIRPSHDILVLAVNTSIAKILFTVFLIFPESALAHFLKKREKIDVYDYNENYRLFDFRVIPEHLIKQRKLKVISSPPK